MTADTVDILDTVRSRRAELRHAAELRWRGEAGAADIDAAHHRLADALDQAHAAGLLQRQAST